MIPQDRPFQLAQRRRYTWCRNACRNQPNVHEVKKLPNGGSWQGAQLTLVIAGQWQHYRTRILKYLRQIAVITPYLRSTFKYAPAAAGDTASAIDITFKRRSEKMPPPPSVRPCSLHAVTLVPRALADWQKPAELFAPRAGMGCLQMLSLAASSVRAASCLMR